MTIVKVKKLTLKALNIDPNICKDKAKCPTGIAHLAIMSGSATGLKSYEDPKGEIQYGLKGEFEGVNLTTGETFQASTVYLPSVALDSVAPLVAKAEKKAEESGTEVNPVTFAYMIRVQDDSNNTRNARGYVYQCISMVPPTENDPQEALRKAIQATLSGMTIEVQPALNAPTAEAPKQIEAPKPPVAAKGHK